MKLEHLIRQTVAERQDIPVEQHNVMQLASLMVQAITQIPNKISWNYDEDPPSVDYIRDLFLDGKSTLFNEDGRCMVEWSDDIYAHMKYEKLELFVGGYDGDYEEFFIEPQENLMVIKRAARTIPGEDEHVVVRYSGHTFNLSRDDFGKVIKIFSDKSVEYPRPGDKIERGYWDEDYGRRPARRQHNEYPPEYDEPEPSEDDFKTIKSKLYGALLYKDLHHV